MGDNPVKTTALYTIGTIANKAIAFVSIPVISRMLTETEYGVLSSFESYVSILTVCIGLAVYETLRNAYVDYKREITSYVSSVFTIVISVYVLVLILSMGLNRIIQFTTYILVILCCTKSFSTAITNIMLSYYMMNENVYKRTALLVFPNLLGTVLGIIVISQMNSDRYLGRIIPLVVCLSMISLYHIISFYRKSHVFINTDYVKYALRLCIPIIPHGLSVTILASSDRIIIRHMTGLSDAGIYGIAYNFGMVAFAFITAFESVWIPRFTRNMVGGKRKRIHAEVMIYTVLTSLVISVIMLCCKEVFELFADIRYWDGIALLSPIIASSFLIHLYSIPAGAEMFYKKNNHVAIASLIAAATNVALNIVCIHIWGYVAAAYTTLASYLLLFIIHFLFMKRIDEQLFTLKLFIPSILIMATSWSISLLLSSYCIIRWSIGTSIVVALLFLAIRYYKRIGSTV